MILLVRHGESVLNAAGIRHRREDSPLTELGIWQANDVALGSHPRTILTSPLLRAYGTACIIAAEYDMPAPIIIPELAERTWGQSCDEAAALARHALKGYKDAVVVTHAGIIKGLTGLTETPANGSVTPWCP